MTPMPQQVDVVEAMPKIIGVLSTFTFGLIGIVWKVAERRIAKVEAEVALKATNEEMNRQRDNIGEIFGNLNDLRTELHEKHVELIHLIDNKHTETMRTLRETIADRRQQARPT